MTYPIALIEQVKDYMQSPKQIQASLPTRYGDETLSIGEAVKVQKD